MSEMSAEMAAELEKLRAENENLKKEMASKKVRTQDLTFKVSDKGGLSVYGLGRFPVTLYKEQWLRLLERVEEIRAFIKDNDKALKSKD